jgi:hypothetical protein
MIYWFSLDYINKYFPDDIDDILQDITILKSPLSVPNGMTHEDLANVFETALKQTPPDWPRSIAVRSDHTLMPWLLIGTNIK